MIEKRINDSLRISFTIIFHLIALTSETRLRATLDRRVQVLREEFITKPVFKLTVVGSTGKGKGKGAGERRGLCNLKSVN